jgi:hypothetical protein
MTYGNIPLADIPLFVAAYTGWNQASTVQSKLAAAPEIDGVLIIDAGLFVSSPRFGISVSGSPLALWALVCCLHRLTSSLVSAATDPVAYAT